MFDRSINIYLKIWCCWHCVSPWSSGTRAWTSRATRFRIRSRRNAPSTKSVTRQTISSSNCPVPTPMSSTRRRLSFKTKNTNSFSVALSLRSRHARVVDEKQKMRSLHHQWKTGDPVRPALRRRPVLPLQKGNLRPQRFERVHHYRQSLHTSGVPLFTFNERKFMSLKNGITFT